MATAKGDPAIQPLYQGAGVLEECKPEESLAQSMWDAMWQITVIGVYSLYCIFTSEIYLFGWQLFKKRNGYCPP